MALEQATKHRAIPDTSRVQDPQIRAILEALRENQHVFRGIGNNAEHLDKAMTFRDAWKAGIVNINRNGQSISYKGTNNTGVSSSTTSPSSSTPPTPTNFQVTAALATLILTWDEPTDLYSNHAYTEIWRSATDDIGTATKIANSYSSAYSDPVGSTGVTRYYWIRFVSIGGKEGSYNAVSGTSATTGKVGNVDLTDLSVTAAKIADGSVDLGGAKITGLLANTNLAQITDATKIADLLISNAKLADLAVDAAKLANSAVTSTKIANLAVGTAAIQTSAITTALIANLAVGTAQIADAAITSAKIGTAAVGSAAIQNAAITNALIADLAVDAAKIANATIVGGKIANATITDANISDLSASKITAGTITAEVSLTAAHVDSGTISSPVFYTFGSHLTSSASGGASTLNLYDTSDFASSGSGYILDSTNNLDAFSWTDKTSTTLTGCTGVLAHNQNAIVIPASVSTDQSIAINQSTNEMYFFGNRGDGTVELLAEIGINQVGADYYVLNIGNTNSGNSRRAIYASSYTSTAIYAVSETGIGIAGSSNTGYGGTFLTGPSGKGMILLGAAASANAPSHEAAIGAIWVTADPEIWINRDGSTAWKRILPANAFRSAHTAAAATLGTAGTWTSVQSETFDTKGFKIAIFASGIFETKDGASDGRGQIRIKRDSTVLQTSATVWAPKGYSSVLSLGIEDSPADGIYTYSVEVRDTTVASQKFSNSFLSIHAVSTAV